MAKHAQQPDQTISLSATGSPRYHFSHPITISSLQKKQERQKEVTHVYRDLRKTAIMIAILIVGQGMLYLLLIHHMVIIPTVNY